VLQLDYDTSQRIHLHATAISFPILFWLKMRLPTAGGAPIRVVQATQDRDRAQRSGTARRLLWGRLRERLPEALMRPRPVAVRHVRAEHAGPLPLAADAPQEALADGVRLRRPGWRAQDRAATGRRDAGARRPERAVVIADRGARSRAAGGGLAPLLGDPGVGRLARRAQVDDAPRGQFDDEAGAQRPEEQVRDREDVARPDLVGVVAQERRPRLPARARRAVAAQLGLDGALGHAGADLPELATDPLGTPARVLGRQPAAQRDRLRRERRAARPPGATPISSTTGSPRGAPAAASPDGRGAGPAARRGPGPRAPPGAHDPPPSRPGA